MNRSRIRLLFLGLVLLSVMTGAAAIMSVGLLDVIQTFFSGSNMSQMTGGDYSVSSVVGQGAVSNMIGGNYELGSGFFGGSSGSGETPSISTINAGSGAIVDGVYQGVALDGAVSLTFTESMNEARLLSVINAYLTRTSSGASVYSAVTTTVSYFSSSYTLTARPISRWQANSVYEISIASTAISEEGLAIGASQTVRFQTVYDNDEAIAVSIQEASTNYVKIVLPAQALSEDAYLIVKTDPLNDADQIERSDIEDANAKMILNGDSYRDPLTIREINAYNSSGERVQLTGVAAAVLSLPYQDNGQGIVPGSNPPVRVKTLAIWTLDETRNLWVRVPGSTLNSSVGTIEAPVRHFSVFAVMGAQDADVSQAYAFPVPWKPYAGDSLRYGTRQGGITFVNLPSQGTLRLYTISGELVLEREFADALTLNWDGSNSRGEEVASGVYLWEMRSADNRKTGKLVVVW